VTKLTHPDATQAACAGPAFIKARQGISSPRTFAVLGAACALALLAGCSPNPMTPTPPPTPVAAPIPPPMPEMGPPSATFTFVADQQGSYISGGIGAANSGTGTLYFEGKRYTFTGSGVSASRVGVSPGPISGEVYNLKNLRDINGTYTVEQMAPGQKEVILKNPQDVRIHMVANSKIEMGVQSVTITLNVR